MSKVKKSEADALYQEFLRFCPKAHLVHHQCKFDSDCLMGKCVILWMIKNFDINKK